MEKSTFTPSCLDRVKKLASQENTHSTLLSIWKEEAVSHVKDTTAQAFEAKTKKALERGLMMVTLSLIMRTSKEPLYSQMQKKQLTTPQMMTLL